MPKGRKTIWILLRTFIICFCRWQESNPGRLRSKQVSYPLLHCLSSKKAGNRTILFADFRKLGVNVTFVTYKFVLILYGWGLLTRKRWLALLSCNFLESFCYPLIFFRTCEFVAFSLNWNLILFSSVFFCIKKGAKNLERFFVPAGSCCFPWGRVQRSQSCLLFVWLVSRTCEERLLSKVKGLPCLRESL